MGDLDLNDRLIAGKGIHLAPVPTDPDQYRDTPAGHCDRALERELLAAVVQGRVDALAAHLRPQAFSLAANVTLATFLVELANDSIALDVPTVTTEIEKRGGSKRGALIGALRDVALSPCAAAPKSAMDRIVDLAESRRVHQVLLRAVDAAARGDIVQAKELALSVGEADAHHVVVEHISKSVEAVAQSMSEHRPSLLIPTTIHAVDGVVGGVGSGSLVVIGAATGTGKTAMMLAMATCSARHGVRAGFVSCEDPRDVIGGRVLASIAKVPGLALRTGDLREDERTRVYNAIDVVMGLDVHCAYEHGATDATVIQSMTRLVREFGCRLLFVDYLQTIAAYDSRGDKVADNSRVCSRIKSAAARLGVPVVLASQLSRPQGGDIGKRPHVHRLKESGDIENAAELVLMLWRASSGDDAPVSGYIAKSKWGGGDREWKMTRKEGLLLEEGHEDD